MKMREWLQRPASDVMTRDVVTLKTTDRLCDAATTFLREQISGAPVVDADGQCVGVLSVKDLISAEAKDEKQHAELVDQFFAYSSLALPARLFDERLDAIRETSTPTADKPVADYMVSNLVSVKEYETLETIIRDLVDGQIHRVVVIDENGKLAGIITTIDILAALVKVPV